MSGPPKMPGDGKEIDLNSDHIIPPRDNPLGGWTHAVRPGLEWAEIDEEGNTVILSDEEMAERYAEMLRETR